MYFSTSVIATLFAAGQLLSLVQAHVEMQSPLPFRSKFIVPNGPNTDFSMTSPLNADGSNFPCKGYQTDTLAPTETLTAGGSFTLQLAGSATHNGGSCQLSLSYDGGKTWVVIHSIVGGCPVDTETYTIPVPSDLPSSSRALLAWSWENNTGNREFYMNCAPVTVVGKGSTSFTGPRMYQANVFGGGQCITPAGVDVVYPNPGGSVQFGGKFVGGNTPGVTDISPCSFDNNVNVTVTGDGTTTNSAPPAPAPAPASPGNSTTGPTAAVTVNAAAADPAPVVTGLSTSTVIVTSTGSVTVTVQPTPGVVTNTVTDNGVDPPATTGAAAPAPAPAPVVAPAPGTSKTTSATADNGAAGAACSPDGTITCGAGGTTFYMCDHGVLVSMGSVAAGTTCSNGQITRKRALPPQIFRRHHRVL